MLCRLGVVTVGLVLVGCGGADVGPAGGADPAAGETSAVQIGSRPPGGLEDWLSEIESGLPSSMDEVSTAWVKVQRGVLLLYTGRQEYIEMYWGPGGRLQAEGGEMLAEAVVELETVFHELLQSLMAQPLDTARVATAVDAVKARVADTRLRAAESGLDLVPPDSEPSARG